MTPSREAKQRILQIIWEALDKQKGDVLNENVTNNGTKDNQGGEPSRRVV